MNKIYKVIWSKVKNCYVVTSELAKSHGKGGTARCRSSVGNVLVTALLISLLHLGTATPVWAEGSAAVTGAEGTAGTDVTLATITGGEGIKVTAEGTVITVAAEEDEELAFLKKYLKHSSDYDDPTAPGASVDIRSSASIALGKGAIIAVKGDATGSLDNVVIGNNANIYAGAANSSTGKNTAIGSGAVTGSTNIYTTQATAIGADARVYGSSGVSIGGGAQVGLNQKIGTVGEDPLYAYASQAIAIGQGAKVFSDMSTAIGSAATAGTKYSKTNYTNRNNAETFTTRQATAVGYNASATKRSSTSVGALAKATNTNSTAIGAEATASGENSSAIGAYTYATGIQNVAMGEGSQARKDETIAVGFHTIAFNAEDIAVGHDTLTFGDSALAMGHLALTSMPVREIVKNGAKYIDLPRVGNEPSKINGNSKLCFQTSDGTVILYESSVNSSGVETGTYYKVKAVPDTRFGWKFVKVDANGNETTDNNQAVKYKASESTTKKDVRPSGTPVNHIDYFYQVDSAGQRIAGTETNPLDGGIALGSYTVAQGEHSMAMGLTTAAYGDNSIAYGYLADTYGEGSAAIGHETVSGAHVLIRRDANLEDVHTTQFGVADNGVVQRILADGSVAGVDKNNIYSVTSGGSEVTINSIGTILTVGGEAFGYDKNNIVLASDTSIAVTRDEATGYYYYTKDGKQKQVGMEEELLFTGSGGATVTVAAGKMKLASGGISLGSYAHAEGDKALAVGRTAGAYGRDSSAVGTFANALGEGAVAIGHNTSTGAEVDLETLDEETNTALVKLTEGSPAASGGVGGVALGSYAHAAGDKAVAIGMGNIVTGDRSVAVGTGHTVSGNNSGAFGDPDNVYANASYAVGNDNTIGDKDDNTKGINTFVMGNNVTTTEEGTVVVGHHAESNTHTFGKNSVSLGTDAAATIENTVALGATTVAKRDKENGGAGAGYDVTTGTNYAGDDKDSATWTSTLGAVSVAGAKDDDDADIGSAATETRQITGLAAGTADTDAVNVAQLKTGRVEVKGDTNITVTTSKDETDNHTIYTVKGAELTSSDESVTITPTKNDKGIVTSYDLKAKDTTYTIDKQAGSGSIVNTYTVKDSDDQTVGTITDTDTKYELSGSKGSTATDGSTVYTVTLKDKEGNPAGETTVTDTNTTYTVSGTKGSGDVVTTYTITGTDGTTLDQIVDTDTNTTYTIDKQAGSGSTVNTYTVKDSDDQTVGTITDTDTKYELSGSKGSKAADGSTEYTVTLKDKEGNPAGETTITDTNTTYTVSGAKGSGDVVTTYTITGSDGVALDQIVDTDTNTTYTIDKQAGSGTAGDVVNKYIVKDSDGNTTGIIEDTNTVLASGTNGLTLEDGAIKLSVEDTAGNKVSGSVSLADIQELVDTTYTLSGTSTTKGNTTTYTVDLTDSNQKNAGTVTIVDTNTTYTIGTEAGKGSTINTYTVTDSDNKEVGKLVDTNTTYKVDTEAGTGSTINTYTVTDSDNKEVGKLVDTNTTYKIDTEAGTGSTINTYTVTDSDNKEVGKLTDTNTTYKIDTEAGTGSTINTYTVTDSDNKEVGKLVDTNTTYSLGGTSKTEGNTTTYTVDLKDSDQKDAGTVTIVDTNTTYKIDTEAGTGSTINTYTVTDSDNKEVGKLTDTNTTYKIATEAGTGSTINTYTVTDSDDKEVGKLVDTNTTYTMTKTAGTGKVVNTYKITGSDDKVLGEIEDTDTDTQYELSGKKGEKAADGSTEYTISLKDKDGNPAGETKVVDTNTQYELFGEKTEKDNGATYQITLKDLEGKDAGNTTVTDTRNTVKAGKNITVDEEKNEDGSSIYTISAKDSTNVKVIDGKHTTVTKGKDGDFTTYAVDVKTDGKVASGDTNIVTGDTVYKETRITKDGNYIKKDNSAAENITVLDEQVKDNSTRIDNITNEFSNMDSRMKKGLAGAAALAALHPMDFDPDDKLTFAAGVGNYRGENAAAIGAFYRPDEKVMFSIGGTVGNGENMVNAGVSFSLDRVNRVSNSRTAMAHEIVELRDHIAKQDARLAKQDEQIARLTDLVNRLAGPELQMKDTVMFPDVPENHWAYEYLDDLQKRGIIEGYPNGQFMGDRAMTRYEYAAMLDRALRKGVSLDDRAAREFGPELDYIHEQSRVRVDRIAGQDTDRYKIERVRVNNEDKATRDIYGSKMPVAKAAEKAN